MNTKVLRRANASVDAEPHLLLVLPMRCVGVPGAVGLSQAGVGCTGLGWAWQYTRLSLRM